MFNIFVRILLILHFPFVENIAIDAGNILRDEIQTTHVHHDGKAFMVH
uniref:Uncharacterized protein n=1 Tax=Nelumbo nucifera TaxID=4432 RepID=A0A822YDQ6_NELNU|nr:TPA_asm: hypothetical protein HUJ06_030654 [Nelumbo nucifera]